jgi:ribosomal protein L7Ae-like RNA K-turn-binding protein
VSSGKLSAWFGQVAAFTDETKIWLAQHNCHFPTGGGSMTRELAEKKIVNLMQFARKAGKIVAGADACIRELNSRGLRLVVIANDSAERSVRRIEYEIKEQAPRTPLLRLGNQETLSTALGVHQTGIFGVKDKQFAARMLEYQSSIANVEEQSAN